jgi:hypothetical protein
MSQPIRMLGWMLGVLLLVAVAAGLLATPLLAAFGATPVFNGVIIGVFLIGVAVNLNQVLRLQREVRFIEGFRRNNPDRPAAEKAVLLAPMAKMLSRSDRKQLSLSGAATRSILDSVYLRLEEQRDLSRYLIGLLIFLGLLGTFWGLLRTIGSVGDIIGGLEVGGDAVAMFEVLKDRLQAPLGGMATSFSTSLFGLAGSLVLGLLDLLCARASNRFYNEVEEWLSGITRLSSGGIGQDGEASVPAYVQALLEQTADGLERMQRALADNERERRAHSEHLAELNNQLGRLADAQGELKSALRHAAQPVGGQVSDELRAEFRLLSRTIAAAVDAKRQPGG